MLSFELIILQTQQHRKDGKLNSSVDSASCINQNDMKVYNLQVVSENYRKV